MAETTPRDDLKVTGQHVTAAGLVFCGKLLSGAKKTLAQLVEKHEKFKRCHQIIGALREVLRDPSPDLDCESLQKKLTPEVVFLGQTAEKYRTEKAGPTLESLYQQVVIAAAVIGAKAMADDDQDTGDGDVVLDDDEFTLKPDDGPPSDTLLGGGDSMTSLGDDD